MKKRYVDPFTPDLPIDSADRFSGREKEVNSIINSLFQLKNGKPKHTIITGDRGIGKSSLLLQAKNMGEGNLELSKKMKIDTDGLDFDFISVWHDCSSDQTPAIIASQVLEEVKSSIESLFKKFTLEFNIAGILSISKKEETLSSITEIVNLFCSDIGKAARKATEDGKTGIIIYIDELDRVKPDSGIASFFKLTAEKLSRDGIKNVSFFTAGITGAIQNLEEEHASIYRTFKDIPLPRLELDDVKEILINGFQQVGCGYNDNVLENIYELCAGYPEPVHLLGSQILSSDEDDYLSIKDFETAKKEVVETLRRNKLASTLRNAGSGKYQKILSAMASFNGANVPLAHITDTIGYEQSQYSANMGNLVKRDIISPVDRGVYCFVDPLLKEYISRFGVIDTGDEE